MVVGLTIGLRYLLFPFGRSKLQRDAWLLFFLFSSSTRLLHISNDHTLLSFLVSDEATLGCFAESVVKGIRS